MTSLSEMSYKTFHTYTECPHCESSGLETSKKLPGKPNCESKSNMPCCTYINKANKFSFPHCLNWLCTNFSCERYCSLDKECSSSFKIHKTTKCCECNYCRSNIGMKMIVLIIVLQHNFFIQNTDILNIHMQNHLVWRHLRNHLGSLIVRAISHVVLI